MSFIKADVGLCQGHANCIEAAGDVFDLDDEALVVVLKPVITEEERGRVEEAIRNCPVAALSLADE